MTYNIASDNIHIGCGFQHTSQVLVFHKLFPRVLTCFGRKCVRTKNGKVTGILFSLIVITKLLARRLLRGLQTRRTAVPCMTSMRNGVVFRNRMETECATMENMGFGGMQRRCHAMKL